LIPVTLFVAVAYAIKVTVEAYTRRRIVESHGSEELVRTLLDGDARRRRQASLQWGAVLLALAVGFGLVEMTGVREVTPGVVALLLGAAGSGSLACFLLEGRVRGAERKRPASRRRSARFPRGGCGRTAACPPEARNAHAHPSRIPEAVRPGGRGAGDQSQVAARPGHSAGADHPHHPRHVGAVAGRRAGQLGLVRAHRGRRRARTRARSPGGAGRARRARVRYRAVLWQRGGGRRPHRA